MRDRESGPSTPGRLAFGLLALAVALFGAVSALGGDPAHREQLDTTGSCPNCDLSGEDLSARDLKEADLSGANLRDANLYRASLVGANLTGADLTGADVRNVAFDGATFTDADFCGGDMTGAVVLEVSTGAITNDATTCPDGSAGPCDFGGEAQ